MVLNGIGDIASESPDAFAMWSMVDIPSAEHWTYSLHTFLTWWYKVLFGLVLHSFNVRQHLFLNDKFWSKIKVRSLEYNALK